MQYASKIDFAALMEPVAALLLGEPNARLSKPPRDLTSRAVGSLTTRPASAVASSISSPTKPAATIRPRCRGCGARGF